MGPERWQKVNELFYAALERDDEERKAFLVESCAGDEELLAEVESLISAHNQAGDFIQKPPVTDALQALKITKELSLIGKRIGAYKILREIGRGGMGAVYLAEDLRLDRKVAIKVLSSSAVKDQERVNRFRQEARSISTLNHPNIITIHDFGYADGSPYIVTEYVEGNTLREQLSGEGLNLSSAVNISIQIAEALVAAHAVGIIHRDIKPENVMLRQDGIVKVLDFGLAKLTEIREELIGNKDLTSHRVETISGVIMGTASYMSPEQVRAARVDARTDVWSLGVVLYEMITGRLPFQGDSLADTFVSILEREVEENPNAPEELQRIIQKSLKKNRDERYQTIKEFLFDLKNLQKEIELTAHTNRISTESSQKTNIDVAKHSAETIRLTTTNAELPVTISISETKVASANKDTRKKIVYLVAALFMFVSLSAFVISLGFGAWAFNYFRKSETIYSPGPVVNQKLYLKMTEGEKFQFVKQQSQRLSEMFGKNPTPLRDNAIEAIKKYVDSYANRSNSTSTKRWEENLRAIYGRAAQSSPTIIQAFNKQGVPPVLGLYIPMVMSEYDKSLAAESESCSVFMLKMELAEENGVWEEQCDDVGITAPVAAKFLNDRIAEFGSDADSITIAALTYYRNYEQVREDLRNLNNSGVKERSFWTLLDNEKKLDQQFQDHDVKFVPKLFAAAIVGENPQAFDLPIKPLSTLTEEKK